MTVKKLTLMAFFSVIALVIFIIEAQIPLPVTAPGLKLGLTNIVTLFLLFLKGNWKTREIFMVFLVRILLAAFITGQAMTLIYSFTGGFTALLVMLVMKKILKAPAPVVSVAGALAHNLGQLTAAAFMTSASVFAYLPLLTAGGIISGLLTGFTVLIIFKIYPKFIKHLEEN